MELCLHSIREKHGMKERERDIHLTKIIGGYLNYFDNSLHSLGPKLNKEQQQNVPVGR